MIVTLATPMCLEDEIRGWLYRVTGFVPAEDGSVAEILTTFGSTPATVSFTYAIGYEVAEDGSVSEVYTTFGSIPATPALCALITKAVAA